MEKPRQLKSKRKESWTNLRVEIKKLSEQFGFKPDDFSEVGINQWQEIENRIRDKFASGESLHWLWERLTIPVFSKHINLHHLDIRKLIEPTEKIYFLVNETVNEKDKYWIYECNSYAIQTIIMQAVLIDEFMLVSKKYDWIVTYNHYEVLTATGDMMAKIKFL